MNVLFHTLGCKVNQYETQVMRKLMEKNGAKTFDFQEDKALFNQTVSDAEEGLSVSGADLVIVINSCTVTGESDKKLKKLIRRYKREYPHSIMVLTGCMPQAFPDEMSQDGAFGEVDIVLGNSSRKALVDHINNFLRYGIRIIQISKHDEKFESMSISEFEGKTRAFVKIQDGCNHFCSYCIIPYARGSIRSKPLDELKSELEGLAEKGYKEIVLVGINLASYGKDLNKTDSDSLSLADAVDTACNVAGIKRVRLGSLDPDMITKSVVDRFALQKEKLCPQFHLSLQSGSDSVLKRMNRHYNSHEYLTVCEMLRAAFSGCAITTDIMVGFPGETDEEFSQSVAFAKKAALAEAHVFAYSPRNGTPAAKSPDQIPSDIKAKRSAEMIKECDRLRKIYLEALVGKTLSVLCERSHRQGYAEGYSDNYSLVRFKLESHAPQDLIGEFVAVKITDIIDNVCFGVLSFV